MKSLFTALIALFVLAACATAPVYAPAATTGGAGYSETQIENNRYFVTYRASGAADAQLVQDFALLRAAEIALSRGATWFWVDRRTLDDDPRSAGGPSVGVSVGGGNFGRSSGVGVGVGVSFPLGRRGEQANAATLEIRLGEGPKPDEANAYDAQAVATNLRPRLAGS